MNKKEVGVRVLSVELATGRLTTLPSDLSQAM